MKMNSKLIPFLILILLLTGIAVFFSIFGEWESVERPEIAATPAVAQNVSRSRRVEKDVREFKNTDLKVGYLGDEGCVNCHIPETESYRKHPMGRSMCKISDFAAKPTKEPFLAGNFRYSVEVKDKQVTHIEEELGAGGKVIKRRAEPISLVIGSGARGNSFLTETTGNLTQSPISWYTSLDQYKLAPGYEGQNLHFERPIRQACLFCHSNQVEVKADKSLALHGLSIGCERCHGPGELHAKEQNLVDGYDPTIVNPAKLGLSRKDDVCYQCHLQLEARDELPGKPLTDFRPGQDIEKFIRRNNTPISDPIARLKAVGHVFQMEESRCYIRSEGKLNCTTCHNPHDYREPEARRLDIIKKCLDCHSVDKECSLPMPTRLIKSPSDDCLACHMPVRNTIDIGHTSLTDHAISRNTPAYQSMLKIEKP